MGPKLPVVRLIRGAHGFLWWIFNIYRKTITWKRQNTKISQTVSLIITVPGIFRKFTQVSYLKCTTWVGPANFTQNTLSCSHRPVVRPKGVSPVSTSYSKIVHLREKVSLNTRHSGKQFGWIIEVYFSRENVVLYTFYYVIWYCPFCFKDKKLYVSDIITVFCIIKYPDCEGPF